MTDPVQIDFGADGKIDLQASAGGLVFTTQTPAAVLAALAADTPLPSTPQTLGSAALQLQPGGTDQVAFDGGNGQVTFGASASSDASLASFFDPAVAVAALVAGDALPAELTSGFTLPALDGDLYLMLRWAYRVQGSAKGTLALSAAGGASFGIEGQSGGLMAVVRRLPSAGGARTGVESVLANWMLPRQVRAASDLDPGTWLVAEIDGSLSASIGAQVGYDFSWLRGVELGQLAGDVALRVQLGVSATVGFDVAGTYALVLARESTDPASEVLRLRLFKLGKRGWNFAFDLAADVTPSTGALTPASLDGFVQAVFGVEAGQLLAELSALGNPQQSLTRLLAGKAEGYVKGLFEEVTGIDVESELAQANAQLEDALAKWNGLEHEVAAEIWQRLGDQPAIASIRQLAQQIVAAPTAQELVAQKLTETGFFNTAGAQWLEALAPQGLLSLVERATAVEDRIKGAAQKTLDVLDESTIESTLGKLKTSLAERFGIDKVLAQLQKAIQLTDPGQLDAWLAARLGAFLDQTLDATDPAIRQKLTQLQQAIQTVRGKADELWAKTRQALNRTYSAKVAYTYQSSTTRQALLDLELDFGAAGSQAAGALAEVLDGDFRRVLLEPLAGVTLHQGTLSHGISRKGALDLTLPGFKAELTKATTARGQLTVSEDDGRLLLYTAEADNEVALAKARVRRTSKLSIAANLPLASRGGVRVFQPGSLRFSYDYDQATPALKPDQLVAQLGPYARLYLAEQFPTDTGGLTSGAFPSWVAELDDGSDVAGWPAGVIGNTLVSLQVSLSAAVGAAWLAGVSTDDAALRTMSVAVQKALRELVPFLWFSDPKRYGDQPSEPLIAYAATPPMSAFKIDRSGVLQDDPRGDIYWWDLASNQTFDALVFSSTAAQNLALACGRIAALLDHQPGMQKLANQYRNTDARVGAIQRTVQSGSQLRANLVNLFMMEALVIHGAQKAAQELAVFRSAAGEDPEKAVAALAAFSAELAEAFNQKVWSVYGKGSLRPLGTLVFAKAAEAFSAALPPPDALLEVTVLKPGVAFPPAGFPGGPAPAAADVALRQVVLSGPGG